MLERKKILTNFSEEQRNTAMKKYELIEPYINNIEKLSEISNKSGVSLRTLYRWAEQYNKFGLVGLIRTSRSDNGSVHVNNAIKKLIEQLRIKNKKMSIATIHRKVMNEFKQESISYYQVYKIINNIDSSVLSLAHNGSK